MNRAVALALLGAAVVASSAAAAPLFEAWQEPGFVAAGFATGLAALAASRIVGDMPAKTALAIVLLVAVAARAIALAEPPLLSTDVYRYVWDGRVQGAGINPYRWVPADPALAFLRDAEVYPHINRADYAHTAYPPFAQMFFFLATRFGDGVDAIRIAFVLCEAVIAAAIVLVLRRLGRPPALVVGYAWHPLAIWEIANSGHVDALVALAVTVAAVLPVFRQRLLGALAAAAAVLVKPYAIAILPAFWRPWEWRAPVFVVALVVLLYLPYLGVGGEVIGFVPTYLQEEGFVAGDGFWLVSAVRALFGTLPGLTEAYLALGLAVLAFTALRILRKPAHYEPAAQIRDLAGLLFVGLFVLSPNYPWYYLPLVPFVSLVGGPVLWTMTLCASLLHLWWPGADEPVARFLVWKSVLNGGWILAFAVAAALPHLRVRTPGAAGAIAPRPTGSAS